MFECIRNNIRRLNDFEKSLRLMSLQMLSTNSFDAVFICYDFLLDTIETIKQDNRLFDKYLKLFY